MSILTTQSTIGLIGLEKCLSTIGGFSLLKYARYVSVSARLQDSFAGTPSTSRAKSSSSNIAEDHYDVIVSGGGMVGCAMGSALGHTPVFHDKRILLLEASPKKPHENLPDKYSSRTCALSSATQTLLEGLGAWDEILSKRCQPVKRMQVWDSCSDAMIVFPSETSDMTEDLATIVENDIIQGAITTSLEKASNVNVQYGARVSHYSLPSVMSSPKETTVPQDLALVQLEDGRTFSTDLLIGADGAKSALRQAANIKTMAWDYDQMGVVAVVQFSEPTINNVAWQRFLETGPIAFLPLSDLHSCMIWSTSTNEAKRLLQLDEDSFVDAVNRAFWTETTKVPIAKYAGSILDNVLTTLGMEGSSSQQLPPTITGIDQSSKAAFPLGLCHASTYVKRRVALIGDAAHRIHPLAGQGVNLGFGDVACLRDQLVKAISAGADLGSLQHLLEYETSRQRSVIPIMAAVDGLARLYGTSWAPVVLLRTLGLQTTNALTPLKNLMVKFARQ